MPTQRIPYQTISLTQRGRIAYLTLERPRAGNRVNLTMSLDIADACLRINQDDSIRVAVLAGKGKAFCKGGDIPSREALPMHRAASHIAAIEKPVVAAINGDALDQGLELALACDLRVAAKTARVGMTQITRGFMPWDGGTQRLPRVVGRAKALEMLFTGRVLKAEEALEAGLVSMITADGALMSITQEMASKIAASAPVAARYAKEAVRKGMDMTLDQGLWLEGDLNLLLQTTRDRAEGIRSFLERRPPRFRGK